MNTLAHKFFARTTMSGIIAFVALLLCTACSGTDDYTAAVPPHCDFGDVRFSSDFAGGRMDGCAQSGPSTYTVILSPENSPINHSPWYSFKVDSDQAKSISVTLEYTEHTHRYVPKLSSDGETWAAIAAEDVAVLAEGAKAILTLQTDTAPLWVSAQEIIDNEYYFNWIDKLNQLPFLERTLLGQSVEGRDIYKLETISPAPGKYLLLAGRQHPPEVTGALGMKHFVERLLARDELAEEFRRQFGILIVPNINPDGVYHGNWRHNVNGIDLNRDWGPFTQPETQLMRDELARFLEPGAARPYLFLDFHSTARDVIYTQLDEMETFPKNFASRWLSALQLHADTEFPGYIVNPKPGHNVDQATSKNYVYSTFGIPAMTFELGDETDRDLIAVYATAAAEEMMKTLLADESVTIQP